MAQKNVLIIPTGDSRGLASLIYYYNKISYNVFILKPLSLGLNAKSSIYWPAYLTKSTRYPDKRNIEVVPFNTPEGLYSGEDHFLKCEQIPHTLYKENITCEFLDLAIKHPTIDVLHTLRCSENHAKYAERIKNVYAPDAAHVSSTLLYTKWKTKCQSQNVAKFIPGEYEEEFRQRNNINLMCNDFERKLLNVSVCDNSIIRREGFASFNNELHSDVFGYELFNDMNTILPDELKVENHGSSNWFDVGSDVRSKASQPQNPSYVALSPLSTLRKMSDLKAVVLFKKSRGGSNVFYHALMTNTPLITTEDFIQNTNAYSYMRAGLNCLIVRTPQEAATAVVRLHEDDELVNRLSAGQRLVYNMFFDDAHWRQFEVFVERAVASQKNILTV